LNIVDGKIVDMKFSGSGCVISQAAASMLAEHIIGNADEFLRKMNEQDMVDLLHVPLGPARRKCATLAFSVAKSALEYKSK